MVLSVLGMSITRWRLDIYEDLHPHTLWVVCRCHAVRRLLIKRSVTSGYQSPGCCFRAKAIDQYAHVSIVRQGTLTFICGKCPQLEISKVDERSIIGKWTSSSIQPARGLQRPTLKSFGDGNR